MPDQVDADAVSAALAARATEVRRQLAAAFDVTRPVALVDFPNHNNCGDNAIWLGERALLAQLGVDVASVSDQASYDADELRQLDGLGTILIHGGGNFGSIWPHEQAFRERVVADHPTTPIVQLPQTLHFDGPEALNSARTALGAHPRFTVLARDERSLAIAADDLGLDARLSPDAAFGLGPLATGRTPGAPIVWMARTDGEGTIAAPDHEDDVHVVDWLRGNPYDAWAGRRAAGTVRLRRLWAASQRSAPVRRLAVRGRARAFDLLAERRLRRGLDILAYGEVVVTDRLHGHILCTLLGKRHVVLDTRQGKLSTFLAAFPPPPGLVLPAGSTDEALDLARGLLGHPG